jgi:hypothetical protein
MRGGQQTEEWSGHLSNIAFALLDASVSPAAQKTNQVVPTSRQMAGAGTRSRPRVLCLARLLNAYVSAATVQQPK